MLSSHKRSSYDAIPIDHTAPMNASSETLASLAPGAPPRFLPPSLVLSRDTMSLDPSLNAQTSSNIDADNSIVTDALAALNASRSAAPDPGPVEEREQ